MNFNIFSKKRTLSDQTLPLSKDQDESKRQTTSIAGSDPNSSQVTNIVEDSQPENPKPFQLGESRAPELTSEPANEIWQTSASTNISSGNEKKEKDLVTEPSSGSKKPKKFKFKKILKVMVILGFLASSVYVYYLYIQSQQELQKIRQASPVSSETEAMDILEEVSKLVILPSEESPTVATVSNVEKLREQSFFSEAENGDKIIIYTKAKKAVLYRPNVGKIVNFASININVKDEKESVAGAQDAKNEGETASIDSVFNSITKNAQSQSSEQSTDTRKQLILAIHDKTGDIKRRLEMEDRLTKELKDYKVGFTEVAKLNATFSENIVLNIKGVDPDVVNTITSITGAKIANYENYKFNVEGDVLILLAK